MKKEIWHFFIIIYIVIAVFITGCLLLYNKYNFTEIGNKIIVIVKDDDLGPYKKDDLLIISKNTDIKVDDYIFYYYENRGTYEIRYNKIDSLTDEGVVTTYDYVSKEMIVSNDEKVKAISELGFVLGILESKWGYLCIVILPIFIAFIYEIVAIFKELKRDK